MKFKFTYSKIITFIFAVAIPFILTYGNKYLDFVEKVKAKDKTINKQKDQIIKRNVVINTKQDIIYGLVEEKEECITTRKILQSNHKEQLKENNKIINQYDYLLDSVHTRFAYKENDLNKLANSNNIVSDKLTTKNSNIPNKNISSLKSTKNDYPLIDKSEKKGIFKRLFRK